MEQLDLTEVGQDQMRKDSRMIMTIMQGPFSVRIYDIAVAAINETDGYRVCDQVEIEDGERVTLKVYEERSGRVTYARCMWDLIVAFGDNHPERECELAEQLFSNYVGVGKP